MATKKVIVAFTLGRSAGLAGYGLTVEPIKPQEQFLIHAGST